MLDAELNIHQAANNRILAEYDVMAARLQYQNVYGKLRQSLGVTATLMGNRDMADTGTASRQSWVAAIVALAGLKGIVLTEAEFAHQGLGRTGRDPIETLRDIASRSGLRLDLLNATLDNVPDMLLPAIFEIDGGRTVLVLQRGLTVCV